MNDSTKQLSGNTTILLRKEGWFSPLRLIRLLIVMFICILVAMVCALLTT
ncbi:MAG TPA: hypothetical protein VMB21_02170 [Candidatus Limnocylindria bacterium]|jgi:hypothetical protein|nr:hypothetical protein [Candidatus Limnocylindria bacterium]